MVEQGMVARLKSDGTRVIVTMKLEGGGYESPVEVFWVGDDGSPHYVRLPESALDAGTYPYDPYERTGVKLIQPDPLLVMYGALRSADETTPRDADGDARFRGFVRNMTRAR